MTILTTNDQCNIYFRSFGSGPLIVFICSAIATHKMWDAQITEIAQNYQCITFDWRGSGRSDIGSAPLSADTIAADVMELISSSGHTSAILVAHGVGGHAALLAAHKNPETIKGIVLIDSAPWYYGNKHGKKGGLPPDYMSASIEAKSIPYPDLLNATIEEYFFKEPVSDFVRIAMIQQQLEWPRFVRSSYAANMKDIDHFDYLSLILQPALIFHGKYDQKQR